MKLNIYLIIGILLSPAFLLPACSSNDSENQLPEPEAPVLTFDKGQQLVFETAGGQADVHFTSTAPWTAEVDQSWCSVTPSRGETSPAVVTLTVTANETPDERNATLILKSGTTTARMTFVQKQKDALTVTSNRIEVGAEGGNVTVEVKANTTFDCQIDEKAAQWLTAVQTRSMTSTQLYFTAAANESIQKREGKIVIFSGELSETVTVYQDGEQPGIILTQNKYTVGSEGGSVTVELRSNVPFYMRMLDNASWLTEVGTRSVSTYTRRFEVAPNEDYDYRSARIAFFNEELGLADTVTITQVQKNAILVAQKEYTVDALGGTLDFSINTNVDFQVSISAEWIRQAPSTRGLAEIPLSFIIMANPDLEPREAVISFTAGELSQSVKVIQAGRQDKGWLRIVHTNQTFSIPTISGPHFSYGRIEWGDGQEEAYQKEAVHTYQDNGSHTVSIELLGAEEVTLSNLIGVTDLDLTQF